MDAIRALQYEGTKVEIAQGFKERGNEMVKAKMWQDAKEFYTKAIAVLTDKSGHQWEQEEDPEVAVKERELTEQCYTNRALCHLKLSMRGLFCSLWSNTLTLSRELSINDE